MTEMPGWVSPKYACTSEEKRSIDKNKYIGYGNSDD